MVRDLDQLRSAVAGAAERHEAALVEAGLLETKAGSAQLGADFVEQAKVSKLQACLDGCRAQALSRVTKAQAGHLGEVAAARSPAALGAAAAGASAVSGAGDADSESASMEGLRGPSTLLLALAQAGGAEAWPEKGPKLQLEEVLKGTKHGGETGWSSPRGSCSGQTHLRAHMPLDLDSLDDDQEVDPAWFALRVEEPAVPRKSRKLSSRRLMFHPSCTASLGTQASKVFVTPLELREVWTHCELQPEETEAAHVAFELALEGTAFRPGTRRAGSGAKLRLEKQNAFMDDGSFSCLWFWVWWHYSTARWMIHPQSMQRIVWDLASISLIIYDLWTAPLEAFRPIGDPWDSLMQYMEWVTSVFWTVDIVMSFRSGVFFGARLEMRPLHVATAYAKTWLIPDLALVVPEWVAKLTMFVDGWNSTRVVRFVRIARFVRMARMVKIRVVSAKLEENLNSNHAQCCYSLLKLSVLLIVAVHLLTCTWFAIGRAEETGWVNKEGLRDQDFLYRYSASARWCLAQINGRTDQDPSRNMTEIMFTCICALCTVIFMSIFISSITTKMLELQVMLEKETKYTRALNSFLERHKLPYSMVYFAREYLRSQQALQNEKENEVQIMALLPKHMQADILFAMRSPVLSKHPFFCYLAGDFPRTLRSICHTVIEMVSVRNTEVVFEKGDVCGRMLFVDRGELQYCQFKSLKQQLLDWAETSTRSTSSKRSLTRRIRNTLGRHLLCKAPDIDVQLEGSVVQVGMWISEAALWTEWRNHGELMALQAAKLMAIDAAGFGNILAQHKDAIGNVSVYARRFAAELRRRQDAQESVLSDIMDHDFLWNDPHTQAI